jgi:splicing factor 3A subunit 3
LNEHKASQVLDRISSRVAALNNLYSDENARRAEVELLSAPQQQNDLSEFYSRLVKIQEHHSKYPDATPGGFDLELAALLEKGNKDGVDDEYEEEDREYYFAAFLFRI